MLPAANAGASLNAAIRSGKFHGTIRPQTPTGSRRVYAWNSPPGTNGIETSTVDPVILVARPAL